MRAIKTDSGDVFIEAIELPECECGNPATYQVMLDLRNAGITARIGEPLCRGCAIKFKNRIAESLPKVQ